MATTPEKKTSSRASSPATAISSKKDDDDDDDSTTEEPSLMGTTAESSTPSATETEAEDDDDDNNDDEEDNLGDAVGFLFEGNYPTTLRKFHWIIPSAAASGPPLSPAGAGGQRRKKQREIWVAVECIDDEPGAIRSGHYLWPGATLLVDYIIGNLTTKQQDSDEATTTTTRSNALDIRDDENIISIVELGSGCGLASLAALQAWQTSLQCLVVTDHDSGVLDRARDNYESTLAEILRGSQTEDELNNVINDIASIPVRFQRLRWGNSSSKSKTSRQQGVQAVRELLEENTNDGSTGADLIIGTDLIDCTKIVEPLLTTAAQLMKEPRISSSSSGDKDDNDGGGRLWLSQSFAFDDEIEDVINITCEKLGLIRTILYEAGGGGGDGDGGPGRRKRRIQEFRHRRSDGKKE